MATKKTKFRRDTISVDLMPDDRIRLNDIIKLARRVTPGVAQQTIIKNLILDMHCRIVKAGYLSLLYEPVEKPDPGNGASGDSHTEIHR